jgi:serine/threonine-protein kinase RsbW
MPTEPPRWRLTIPSDRRQLPVARGFVEAVCQTSGFAAEIVDAVALACHEAIDNVIRHAHQDRPGAYIQIECRLADDGIEICLFDEGKPFDLTTAPLLDPSEVRLGGRGVFLIRKLMDEVSCQARGERGNTLRMVKHCPRNPDPSARG